LQGGRSYTANELAKELEVSRRTVFRDLNMLEMAHIPYYFDDATGGYKISRHFFLPPINLTLTEALAILMLTSRLKPAGGLPLLQHSARAAAKLENALPRAIRQQVGSVMSKLSISLSPLSRHEGLDGTFDELANAIVTYRICRIVYISFYERKQIALNIHPLRLVFIGRAWYLIAYSSKHKELRTFKLGRIKDLSQTREKFTPSANVKLENYFGGAWSMIPEGNVYDIHLRFGKVVAGNVAEVQWHESQKTSWNNDGSLDFRVKVDGLGEITWWILGYGDQVDVLKPALLRKRVANTAAEVVKKYRKERR